MSSTVWVLTEQRRRIDDLGRFWCRLAHSDVTWPMRGQYRCRSCHRVYRVPWDEPAFMSTPAVSEVRTHEAARPATVAA